MAFNVLLSHYKTAPCVCSQVSCCWLH